MHLTPSIDSGSGGVQHRRSNIRTKTFPDNLSNSDLAVRRYSEAGATSPAEGHFRRRHAAIIWLLFTTRTTMARPQRAKRWSAISMCSTKRRRLPAPGSSPAACNRRPHAKSLRKQSGGEVLITDGSYLETKEHIGGFGYSTQPTWMRPWRGDAKPSSPAAHRWRLREFLAMPTE
jgi:hypothetical protein